MCKFYVPQFSDKFMNEEVYKLPQYKPSGLGNSRQCFKVIDTCSVNFCFSSDK